MAEEVRKESYNGQKEENNILTSYDEKIDEIVGSRDTVTISKEEYETQLNRLGNLTLATRPDNSKMSNNPFDYKREILSKSGHINMNKEILEIEKWNIEEIENRTNRLIDRICLVYPYESSSEPEMKKYSIFYKKNNCNINAYIYEDGTVEIQPESYIELDSYNDEEIKNYIEEDELISRDDGYIVNNILIFESIEKVTCLFFNDIDNMWEDWVDANNIPLNFELRAKIMNFKKIKLRKEK